MSTFSYQAQALKILRAKKYYAGKMKTDLKTSLSYKAAAQYVADCEPGAINGLNNRHRLAVAVVQCYCREMGFNPGKIDGYIGPNTSYAVEQLLGSVDFFKDSYIEIDRPNEHDVPEFYGAQGEYQVRAKCPYPLYLAWNNDQTIDSFLMHEKVAGDAEKAMEAISKAYTDVQIRAFGLDQFGGSLNVRLKRGSKTQWSMHSWGIAIDWFPQKNQYKWHSDKAYFARAEYKDFLDIWEAHGFLSLGRARDYDWMHVQAAML